jgi:hypothetical protein
MWMASHFCPRQTFRGSRTQGHSRLSYNVSSCVALNRYAWSARPREGNKDFLKVQPWLILDFESGQDLCVRLSGWDSQMQLFEPIRYGRACGAMQSLAWNPLGPGCATLDHFLLHPWPEFYFCNERFICDTVIRKARLKPYWARQKWSHKTGSALEASMVCIAGHHTKEKKNSQLSFCSM